MSSGQKIPLKDALKVAQALVDLLKPHALFVEIAGSIRRKKEQVGDIEIVIEPLPSYLPFMETLLNQGTITKADYNGSVRWGPLYKGVIFNGMRCEIFSCDENNRGVQFLLRTGPGDGNTRIMIILGSQKAPWRFKEGYLWYSRHWEKDHRGEWDAEDKQLIPCPDETTVFKALGITYKGANYIEPPDRTENRYAALLSHSEHLWGSKPHVCQLMTGRIHDVQPGLIDITVKSASTDFGRVLAPIWEMVMGHKAGTISDAEYTAEYLNILRAKYKAHPDLFHDILKMDKVILGCYCSSEPGTFCHRHLAKDVLKKIAASQKMLVYDAGEVQPKVMQMELW